MPSAGQYYSPIPLDFVILDLIPAKGILGGVHWAGRPVRHVTEEINRRPGLAEVNGQIVGGRLRSLKVGGYVEDFAAAASQRIWARTPAGSEFLARREEVLGA